jgi:hypothetical protein
VVGGVVVEVVGASVVAGTVEAVVVEVVARTSLVTGSVAAGPPCEPACAVPHAVTRSPSPIADQSPLCGHFLIALPFTTDSSSHLSF